MGKQSKNKEITESQIAKRLRNNEKKAIKRALKAQKPNKKQRKLIEKLEAARNSQESKDNLANRDGSSDQRDSQYELSADQKIDCTAQIETQVAEVEEKQLQEDGTFSEKDLNTKSVEKVRTPKIKQVKQREESVVMFFRGVIANTEASAKMQKEYERLIQAGLNSYDSEQLNKVRKIFTDEQVVTAYKRFLTARNPPRPKEFELLSIDEQVWLCFSLAEQLDIVAQSGYSLALELFSLLANKRTFGGKLQLSAQQTTFVRKSLILAFEEAENISQSLIEVVVVADLIPEFVEILHNKNLFSDQHEISKQWSYGAEKFPSFGMDKGSYRLFFVVKSFYQNLSHVTLKSIQGGKFLFRTSVLKMIDQCGPTLQERIVHLLAEHTAPDESITSNIFHIVKCMQQNPQVLDFCISCEDKGKLNVDGIAVLIQYLISETKDNIRELMKGTYWEAYSKLDQERNARCRDGINGSVMLTYVQQLKMANEQVFQCFPAMEAASKTLALTNPLYKHSPFQTAVSCFMAQTESCAILSKAGTGKTNMIFILCRRLLNDGKKFAIVVANEYLYYQMYQDVKLFFPDEEVDVIQVSEIDSAYCKGRILILDEADAMIDNHKIIIQDEHKSTADVGGLVAAARAMRLVLLSATFAPHHRHFMRQVLSIKSDKIYEFKNATQLTINSAYNQLTCSKHVFQKLAGFQQLNRPCYVKIAAEKPIIAFIEQKDLQFEEWLCKIAQDCGAPFYVVETIEEARQYREALKQSRLGVMLVSTQFARGFDLKMAQDGFGMVIANGTQLKPSTISQMFGRTNRSQGQPEGVLVMIDARHKTSEEAWRMIEARDKVEPTHGFVNLGALAKIQNEIGGSNFALIKTAYSNDAWMITEHQFTKNNKKLTQLFQGQQIQEVKERSQSKPQSQNFLN